MKEKATEPTEPPTEQRAEDQDAAMVSAFIAGTLPEEDRRDDSAGDEPAGMTMLPAYDGSAIEAERPPVPCDTNGLPLPA